jgi:hypothetical protein
MGMMGGGERLQSNETGTQAGATVENQIRGQMPVALAYVPVLI